MLRLPLPSDQVYSHPNRLRSHLIYGGEACNREAVKELYKSIEYFEELKYGLQRFKLRSSKFKRTLSPTLYDDHERLIRD